MFLSPRSLLVTLGLLLLSGCGGGGGGGGGGSPGGGGGGGSDPLADSLRDFGVDTRRTPRLNDRGKAKPDHHSPFGSCVTLARTTELYLLGLPQQAFPGDPLSLLEVDEDPANPATLDASPAAEVPWAMERDSGTRAFPQTLRDGTAADLDGDGREEVVFAYLRGSEIWLHFVEDEQDAFERRDERVFLEPSGIDDLTILGGDFDGDAVGELAIGYSRKNGTAAVIFAEEEEQGTFVVDDEKTREFTPTLNNAVLSLRLACGNLDDDNPFELVVVLNEYTGSVFGPTTAARYWVYDDWETEFARLKSGRIQAMDQNGAPFQAVVAGASIGDVDADNVGEVLLAGLTDLRRNAQGCSNDYVLQALDDAVHDLKELGNRIVTDSFSSCGNGVDDPRIQTVHVNALDLDGDGLSEVQVNRMVFEDFDQAGGAWVQSTIDTLPQSVLWTAGNFGHFEKSTSSFVVGDFDGDDRDDIAVCRGDLSEVSIWGRSQVAQNIQKIASIPVSGGGSQFATHPVLIPCNVDVDSPVLAYSDAEYRYVFTEPLVIAVLAAAPCKTGIGQNVDACRTAFGNTTAAGSERSRSVSYSASVSVGVNLDGGFLTQSELSLKETLTRRSTYTVGSSYKLEKSILFTSGPSEDLVVFTTIPVDQYTYTVVSHPDPQMIGEKVVVSLPRDPITLQAERGFYNAHVGSSDLRIDSSVFQHRVGDPASYPTRTQKNLLLNVRGGLENGPVAVGQGGGDTQLGLTVGTEVSSGRSLEMGFEVELEATSGGVLGGFTVGTATEDSLSVSSGEFTTYTGTVGAIASAVDSYQFGLFTYVQRDARTGQEFQVVNYWVE